MTSRRTASVVALLAWVAAAVLAVSTTLRQFPRGTVGVAALLLALVAAWTAIRRRGTARHVGLGVAVLLLAVAIALFLSGGVVREGLLDVALLLVALAATRQVFSVRVVLPQAKRPHHPFLVWNPRSGGGKAARADLAEQARARGIEPVELKPGDDLEALVRDAVARGADALAAAGGDGTQALVASIAAEHDLPFACIPAGTRNHFALDLGVDRTDVVGALDAFVDGGERRVDLADVNGRIFVNNVSLGLYAQAVQRSGYRDAKLRTILDTVPEFAGVDAGQQGGLSWTDADGTPHPSATVILVSNNVYRLGHVIASGTRPRLDSGRLGVAVLADAAGGGHGPAPRWSRFSTPTFVVESQASVPAGVDGEALLLDPPLRFAVHPGALRVRLAPQHPGVSPSAALPESVRGTFRLLLRYARGRAPL